jgi:hypothetical protein
MGKPNGTTLEHPHKDHVSDCDRITADSQRVFNGLEPTRSVGSFSLAFEQVFRCFLCATAVENLRRKTGHVIGSIKVFSFLSPLLMGKGGESPLRAVVLAPHVRQL